MITDVKDSTKAIREGRYRDVNKLGAAVIAAAKNLLGEENFLYVFGGDGATLLLSDSQYQRVSKKINALSGLARERFQLKLRVGSVQVKEVVADGHKLKVALLLIQGNQKTAVFLGGGLTRAEQIIKSRDFSDTHAQDNSELPLQGLSCRWQSMNAEKGSVVSLLVACRNITNVTEVYADVIAGISQIVGGNIDNASPVHIHNAKYKGLFRLLIDETRFHQSIFNMAYLKRSVEIAICVLCFKLGIPLFEKHDYISSIPSHSDYKKVDDILRMVLDLSSEQMKLLTALMELLYRQEKIYYGIHESPGALMTCLVEGLADGQHVHFIDGSDGGYARAAEQMKRQMKS